MNNNLELGGSKPSINALALEEIKDFDNQALRALFEEEGLVNAGEVIKPEDFEAIKTRALILEQDSDKPLSAKASLIRAYVDRMQFVNKFDTARLKEISNSALHAIIYMKTGDQFSDQELELFCSSPMSLDEWIDGRLKARETIH
ncbi:MAG: hypothetical protein AAB513_01685 [Patescibacteria group bacterium]